MDTIKMLPLNHIHQNSGGKMIEYAGWSLPERYSSSVDEHLAVRAAAGLFDASHMGKAILRGERAIEFLQRMIVSDVETLREGQSRYSLMCYPDGGLLDDIYIYRFAPDYFLLTFNAINAYISQQWLLLNPQDGAVVTDVTDEHAILALHGPLAETILQNLTGSALSEINQYHFINDVSINNSNCLLSRAGFCGEDGFEIFSSQADAPALWQAILEAGKQYGILPVGLGARDSLRLEAGSPLYGNELVPDINPIEAGLGGLVSFEKTDFIGRSALIEALAVGINRKLTGLILDDQSVPRNGHIVEFNSREIGRVTSGGYSPTLRKNICMALLEADRAVIGENVDVVIRNKRLSAIVTELPFI